MKRRRAELITRYRFIAFLVLGVVFVLAPLSHVASSAYLLASVFLVWVLPWTVDRWIESRATD